MSRERSQPGIPREPERQTGKSPLNSAREVRRLQLRVRPFCLSALNPGLAMSGLYLDFRMPYYDKASNHAHSNMPVLEMLLQTRATWALFQGEHIR